MIDKSSKLSHTVRQGNIEIFDIINWAGGCLTLHGVMCGVRWYCYGGAMVVARCGVMAPGDLPQLVRSASITGGERGHTVLRHCRQVTTGHPA